MKFINKDDSKAPRQKFIGRREFVEAWMKYDDIDQVADKFGITRLQAQAKASNMRMGGVKLPLKGRSSKPDSVEELNRLIERSLRKKS